MTGCVCLQPGNPIRISGVIGFFSLIIIGLLHLIMHADFPYVHIWVTFANVHLMLT